MDNSKHTRGSQWQLILGILSIALLVGLIVIRSTGTGFIAQENIRFEGNQKVAEDSALRMTFPDPMDSESLKEHIETPVGGDASWEGNTMVFQPDEPLKRGETYTFHVDREARLSSGAPVNKDLEYRFTVAGPPTASSTYPSKDAVNIDPQSKIHLVFDRPMIPLSAVQGEGVRKYNGSWPVTLSPQVPGSWRWLGTTTAEFTPDKGLQPGTAYTVNVPKGIVSINGDQTVEDFSWSFETIRPKVLSTDPAQDSDLNGPETQITLTFNQEMDLRNSAGKISLKFLPESGKAQELGFDLKFGSDEVEDHLVENRKKVVLVPRAALQLNQAYQVLVEKDIRSASNALGSEEDTLLNFRTVGDFKIDTFDSAYRRVGIIFSNPVNDETLKGNLTLDPQPEGWEDLELKTSPWSDNRELYIYPNLKPSTKYTLTLSEKVQDRFGQALVEPRVREFTTEPLDPQLNILSQGDFGIFEKGQAPVYPFQSVNISQINLEMARVPFNDFMNIRQILKDDWRYEPDLSQYIGYEKHTLKTENKLDHWETVNFDIQKETGRTLIPGIYALSLQAPEYKRTYDDKGPIILYQYFSITNNALTLKYSGGKALVWLINMQTAKPVPEADITFYDLHGNAILSGRTDSGGFFETPIDLKDFQTVNNEYDPEFWVTASKDGDFTFLGSNWNNGLQPWNFGLPENFHSPQNSDYLLDAYLYTERQAYRPGDTVNFKGITRLRDKNGIVSIPKNFDAYVVIHDAKGNEIYSKTLDLNDYGSFSAELPLDPDAALGRYDISLNMLPEDKVDQNYESYPFYVLAYRKPDYKVEVAPKEADYVSGDNVEFKVTGNYYFGAPMDGAKVQWNAVLSDYWFNRYTDGWYSFALEDNWCWWDCQSRSENLTEGEGTLDKNGSLNLRFPVDLSDKGTSQMVTLYADVTDPNNQVVSGNETVPVHKAGLYVGVRMEDYSVSPGEKAKVNIVTVNPDGTPKPDERVTISLYSREWNTIKKKSVDGFYYYENEPKDTFKRETTVKTGKDGKATAELLVESGGSYRVVAEATDAKGQKATAGTSLYAFSNTYINWPHSNDDRVDVIADKPEYSVGDTAKLLVKSPYQGEGVKALITVERENVISKKIIDVSSNAQPFEIPITEDLIPNAYVSVVIVKPRTGEGDNANMPALKIGYARLLVETKQKDLKLDIGTDKAKYGPGETVTVTIKSTDYAGKPVPAEVSLGVVDLSVQALLGFQMPNLIREFYEQRGLGVHTSEMLTYLVEAFKPGSKGGGGGGPEAKERSDFKDTAYWNPNILTDENGKATLSFKLPDNLTTWQLLAIGHTKGHQYGATAHEILETKKTIVRPLRPRFAVEGDKVNLGATVHNFTEEDQTFTVTLDGDGFTHDGTGEAKLTIKPGEMAKAIFPVTVSPGTSARLHFKAVGHDAVDDITESIPVYEFGTPQSVATSGQTDAVVTEQIYIPGEKEARRGTLSAVLSPTLASYLPKGLKFLAQFPYGCAEQTVSSFLPNIALKSLQNFDAFEIVDDATLEKNITAGLEKLYNFQRSDGGFGYWSGSTKSYSYLTAYILYALNITEKAGYSVDHNVVARAADYLRSVLRTENLEDPIDLTTRAYILYVLAENGQADLGLMNNLYEKREALPIFARAHLAMAYGVSAKARTLLQEIVDTAKIDARGAHFEEVNESTWLFSMNTNDRTTALVLQAMVRITPDQDLIPKIVRYLLAIREQGHWTTTQSTVATLLALTDFLKSTGELNADYTATLKLGSEEVLSQLFSAKNVLSKAKAERDFESLVRETYLPVTFEKEGQGRLYYDLSMDYFLTQDEIEPTDQGIGITREMVPLKEGDKGFKVQGTYRTTLTITVPEDRHFVAVSSPLPAGMEPIDFTLQTSQQQLKDEVNQGESGYWWDNPIWRFVQQEFRDDQMFLFADYLPAGVYKYEYLTRATTAGTFRQRPARAWEMYYPETFGQTDGGWLEIKE